MSAYLDTGSVLIESACNVERIAAMLYTLAPFIPDFKYFRWAAAAQLSCCAVLWCDAQCRVDHTMSTLAPQQRYDQ